MNNKEIQEKILLEMYNHMKRNYHKSYTNVPFKNWQSIIGFTDVMGKAINLTIALEKKRHDDFVEKLKDLLSQGTYGTWKIHKIIDELNKEEYGDE